MTRIWNFSTEDHTISQIYTRLAFSCQRKIPQVFFNCWYLHWKFCFSLRSTGHWFIAYLPWFQLLQKASLISLAPHWLFPSSTRSWLKSSSTSTVQPSFLGLLCGLLPQPLLPSHQHLSPPAAFQQHFLPLKTQSLLHLWVWIMLECITLTILIFLLSVE